jgi:DUF971 family protein
MRINMSINKPTNIDRPTPDEIRARWADGFESTITLEAFRDNCPCAVCADVRKNNSANPNVIFLGKYDLKSLNPMGNYAINAIWADRHDSGIYDWDLFRDIFEKNNINKEQ